MKIYIKENNNICDIIKNEILNTKSDKKALTNIKKRLFPFITHQLQVINNQRKIHLMYLIT